MIRYIDGDVQYIGLQNNISNLRTMLNLNPILSNFAETLKVYLLGKNNSFIHKKTSSYISYIAVNINIYVITR